jgi:pilus assembly protein CpaB
MGAARIIVLSIALVAAIGLAVVIRNMLISNRRPVAEAQAKAPETPMTRILVAKRDLPVGTRLQPDDLGWQSWPVSAVNATFITDGSAPVAAPVTKAEKAAEGAAEAVKALTGSAAMDNLTGAVVREPILAGEPVQERKLVRGGEGGYLAVVLQPGMRAVGVPVTVESGAGGFILPGDRVDVIQSCECAAPGASGTKARVTQTVVVNVRVLAIDQKTAPDTGSQAIVGAVATLEVTPDAADAVVEAMARGPFQLALRSYADANAPSGRGLAKRSSSVKIFSQGETTEMAVAR